MFCVLSRILGYPGACTATTGVQEHMNTFCLALQQLLSFLLEDDLVARVFLLSLSASS